MRDRFRRAGDWLFCSNAGGWILCVFAAAVIVYIVCGLISGYVALDRDVIQHLQR